MTRSHLQLALATLAFAASGLAVARSTLLGASYDVARDKIYAPGVK